MMVEVLAKPLLLGNKLQVRRMARIKGVVKEGLLGL